MVQPAQPTKGPDVSSIIEGLNTDFLLVFLLALVSGAVGGLVYELLILQGRIEWPHKPTEEEKLEESTYAITEFTYDLGVFARLIIGALAAVAAMLVFSPSTTFTMIATALVAGSAGTSVFRSVQDRLLAVVAQKDAADSKAQASAQAAKVEEISTELAAVKEKVVKTRAPVDASDLDKLDKLLSEAKGISEIVRASG